MAEVAFDSARFLDLVRQFTHGAPDSAVVEHLKDATIAVVGDLGIWQYAAEPSGDDDGNWVGSHNGYDYARIVAIEEKESLDRYFLTDAPQVEPTTNPDGVIIYIRSYNGENSGGGAARRGIVETGLDAENQRLIYAVKPKQSATGLNEQVFDEYREVIRFGALMRMTHLLNKNMSHEDYRMLFFRFMREHQNPKGVPPLGTGAERRPAIAPDYGSGYGSGYYRRRRY